MHGRNRKNSNERDSCLGEILEVVCRRQFLHLLKVTDAVASFHDSLNSVDQHISFTIEHESNGQLPSLDTLILRYNGKLMVDIYCKPTHTDRYLDFHSHHDRKHKISTAETLLHRALNLPNIQVGKTRKTAHVCAALHSNGYLVKIAADVIRKKARSPPPTPTPEELVGMFFKWAEPNVILQSFPTSKASQNLSQESSRNTTSKSPADR